jgi:cardiolipin synthase
VHGIWTYLAGAATISAALLASGHAVLHKREVRAAVGWVGLIWLVPVAGAVLYLVMGVNRIGRRGTRIHATMHRLTLGRGTQAPGEPGRLPLPFIDEAMVPLSRVVDRVTRTAVTPGNQIDPLVDGDEAYPAMLEAIESARSTVALCSYIFDQDRVGRQFEDALARATGRGVEVRVLVDGMGALYSKPRTPHVLKRRGVPVAEFLPTSVLWKMPYFNLRNHRKILVIDGRLGFTGGLNIREGCLRGSESRNALQDLHFRMEGPVVHQLMDVFARDWAFSDGERLGGDHWFPPELAAGEMAARGIPDGPDDDFERLHWTILAGLSCAERHVRIVTPYFLPDQALISALNVAALRGVRVDIVLPQENNLRIVGWAMRARLWQVMESGCRIWLTPPPFDHTKLMLVDSGWSLFGSGNWDPRSLRLNFEFNVECYDPGLAARLEAFVQSKIDRARPLAETELDERSLPIKLRDGVAWLFSPYL